MELLIAGACICVIIWFIGRKAAKCILYFLFAVPVFALLYARISSDLSGWAAFFVTAVLVLALVLLEARARRNWGEVKS